MTRTSRRLAAGALVLAGGIALSGCNTDPGSAAVVGSTTISVNQLSSMVKRAYADPQAASTLGSKVDFQRSQLSRLVSSAVLRKAAEDRGITLTEGEVDQRLQQFVAQAGSLKALQQQAEKSGFAASDLRGLVRDVLLQEKLGDALVKDATVPEAALRQLYQQNIDQFDQVHAAHILVKDKKTADAVLAQAKAHPGSFAALAKKYSIDTGSAANGGDLGFAGHSSFVTPFADAIFSHKPGSIFEVQTQYGWHVVKVIDRRTTTFEQAAPNLRRAALQQQLQQREAKVFAETAAKLGVHVNPRFGRYDAATNQVVARNDKLSQPAQQSTSGQPASPLGG